MSDALRSLLAEFVVSVDKAGELAKGNEAVDALKARLAELVADFAKVKAPAQQAAKAVGDVFARAAQSAQRNLQSISAAQLGGRADNNGWGAAGAMFGGAKTVGPDRSVLDAHVGAMQGPTRETLEAGRAAAAAYAQTLKGRLAGAIAEVRAGFMGGGAGGGGGLIGSLATVRNGLIALGAGAAVHAVKRLVDGIGDISEGASRLGVSTDEFQRLSVYARQNATDVGTLGTAFRTLATNAVDPSKESAEAFRQLGVSVKDGAGQFKTSQQLFFETGEALAGVGNETVRTQLAQKLLGRSAIALKPMFAQGTEAFRKQREEMLKLRVLSPEIIAAADDLSDSWVVLSAQLLGSVAPALKNVLFPALKTLTEFLAKGIEWLGKWLEKTDTAATAITALAFATQAKLIPALVGVVRNGIEASGSMLKFAGSVGKVALNFARLALGLLVLQDFITFFRGGDSEVGRFLDSVFGEGTAEGTQKAVNDLAEAFKDLWNWMTGNGQGEKVKALFGELDLFFRTVRSDLLSVIGIGQGGIHGAGVDQGQPGFFEKLGSDAFKDIPGTVAYEEAHRSMPAPGPGQYGPPPPPGAAPSVTVGDNVVNITMGPGASATDVARKVAPVLQDNRDALIAAYPGI